MVTATACRCQQALWDLNVLAEDAGQGVCPVKIGKNTEAKSWYMQASTPKTPS